MKSEWNEMKLGNVTKFQQGKQIELEDQFLEKTNEMTRFVRIIDYTSENEAPRYIKVSEESSSYVTEDDVVMIRYGSQTAGKVVMGKSGIIANNMFRVIPIFNDLDRKYLYFYLKTPNVYSYLRGGQSSSTMPAITFGLMSSLDIKIPPLPIQKKIAHILSTLDDKIELNRKMNQTLEEIAQALFKSWFVDFDPVHAKAKCSSDKELETAACELGISKDILELFPSEFEESELGMIPKGWEVEKIGKIGNVITGKTPPTKDIENYGDKYPFITIPDMHNQIYTVSTERYLSEIGHLVQSNKLIPKDSLIVSCIATVGLVSINAENSHTNQQINNIVCDKKNLYYLYCMLSSMTDKLLMYGSAGTATLNINKSTFENIKILLARNNELQAFLDIAGPMFGQILANTKEIQTLQKTRDTLLPKLLSGELDVSELELDMKGN